LESVIAGEKYPTKQKKKKEYKIIHLFLYFIVFLCRIIADVSVRTSGANFETNITSRRQAANTSTNQTNRNNAKSNKRELLCFSKTLYASFHFK
jgi:hypothetical protein